SKSQADIALFILRGASLFFAPHHKFESRDWELSLRLVPLPTYRHPERSPLSFLHTGKKSVRDSRKTQNKNVVDEMAHTC
ncbi:MAG: hypothetical protein SO159_03475, partial [Dialister sp.]|nr:hypothetical protein [Dialister sp.]